MVHADEETLAAMDPVVVEMHTKSRTAGGDPRLHHDARGGGCCDPRVHPRARPRPGRSPLCGNSIGTDRRFLARYLPDIENHLHYRSVDVSSVKELVKRWYPDLTQACRARPVSIAPSTTSATSIDELRYYRGVVFVPPAAVAGEPAITTNGDDGHLPSG